MIFRPVRWAFVALRIIILFALCCLPSVSIAEEQIVSEVVQSLPLPNRLLLPISPTLDPLGRVLIIDGSNGAIWVIDPEKSQPSQTFLASGQASPVLENPTKIFADWGLHVYTLDPSLQRISVFDLQGRFETSFDLEAALTEAAHSSDVEFTDLVVDKTGSLAVLDRLEGRVFIFDPNGKLNRVLGEDFTGDERLIAPTNLEIDPVGNLYVADPPSGRVLQIGRQGSLLRIWKLRDEEHPQSRPTELAYSSGVLWVADPGERRMLALFPGKVDSESRQLKMLRFEWLDRTSLELAGIADGRLLVLDSRGRRLHLISDPYSQTGR